MELVVDQPEGVAAVAGSGFKTLEQLMQENPEAYDFSDIPDPAPAPASALKEVSLETMLGRQIKVVEKFGYRLEVRQPKLSELVRIQRLFEGKNEESTLADSLESMMEALPIVSRICTQEGEAWGDWKGATVEDLDNFLDAEDLSSLFVFVMNRKGDEQGANPPTSP